MARVIEANNLKELSGNDDIMDFAKSLLPKYGFDKIKLRIENKFLPSYTIDLMSNNSPSKGSIFESLRPTATILIGGKAYKIDPYSPNKMSETDAKIFDTPTTLDSIMKFGIIPTVLIIAGIGALGGYLIYKRMK